MKKLDYKISDVSHIPAGFRPVPQSCTSSTLLPHMTKTVSRYATLSSTFIIKQALNRLLSGQKPIRASMVGVRRAVRSPFRISPSDDHAP